MQLDFDWPNGFGEDQRIKMVDAGCIGILKAHQRALSSGGDREPIIVNISHESKSVGKSEAVIWQWMRLIG